MRAFHGILFASLAALAVVVGQPLKTHAAPADTPILVGWRLPMSIVIRGAPIAGAERLREEEMKDTGVEELDVGVEDSEEDVPTTLARFLVFALSRMDLGRIELKDGRLTVEGIADGSRIDALKKQLEARAPRNITVAALRIDPADRAPFHWIAEWRDSGITLHGNVEGAAERAKLVGMARKIAGGGGQEDEGTVVDRMASRQGLPPYAADASEAALAQLSGMLMGFVGIYGNRVDLIASSSRVGVSNSNVGCRALAQAVPKTIQCGVVDIKFYAQRPHTYGYSPHRYYRYGYHQYGHHHARHGRHRDDERPSSPPKKPAAFVAAKPKEFVSANLVSKSSSESLIDIMFATVRKLDTSKSSAEKGEGVFSGERSEALSFGRARVGVPKGHKLGHLELPRGFSLFGYQLWGEETDPAKHFVMLGVQSLTPDQWDSLVDSIGPHEALIFVHGFNNTFEDGVFRFAQIAVDLQYKGLPVLFSWASRGDVADYEYDRNSALVARSAFLQLLDNLQKKHGITKVHVIAHSMGNFLVLDALANMGGARQAMGELIMAAPDIDRDEFKLDLPKLKGAFNGLTLYASGADRALRLSMKVAGGIPRAGYVPPEGPVLLPGLETLDATTLGEDMFGLNHSTYAEARPLIDDIGLILQGRRAPRLAEERPEPAGSGAPKYWRFAP